MDCSSPAQPRRGAQGKCLDANTTVSYGIITLCLYHLYVIPAFIQIHVPLLLDKQWSSCSLFKNPYPKGAQQICIVCISLLLLDSI